MQKILLFKLGAIGDVLMTTPFVRQLRKGLGEKSDITYMVGKRSSEVLIGNPNIDEIITFDEDIFSKRDIWRWMKLILRLRKLSKEYETIVVFDKHWILNLTAFLAGFMRKIGFDRMGKDGIFLTEKLYYDASRREVEYYFDLLPFFDIEAEYSDQKYDIFGGIMEKVNNGEKLSIEETKLIEASLKKKKEIDNFINDLKKRQKKILGISTGGGNLLTPNGDCRWWSLANWQELTRTLIKDDNIVLLLGAKSDRTLDMEDGNFINLLGRFTIIETIYLINQMDFIICQESGFAHFVGCTHTPMIALAGPTNPERFYPKAIDGSWHPMEWIWKETKECYDVYGGYGQCRGDEMDGISVEEVIEKVNILL